MKRQAFFIAACMSAFAAFSTAKAQDADSSVVHTLSESFVTAVQAPSGAPFAMSGISANELRKFSNDSRELPYLLRRTPGVLAWGENGLGTGTTYLRIRGAGDSRINVTIDGVPLNSPEDQCVFWANLNSYSSFLSSVQIQRGVGSSSNGDGAFGGTVALCTKIPSRSYSAQADFGYGSFNTFKAGASFSTGLMRGRWIVDGGYHQTSTDGWIHGTEGHSGSWIAGVTWVGKKNLMLRYRNIGNFEHTGQAWNGVETGELLDGTNGVKTGIFSYEDLYRVGLGRYNSLCESWTVDEDGNYSFSRYPRNTTDNFVQDHNILSFSWKANELWSVAASAHYTHGQGFYNEFKPYCKLSKFGIVGGRSDVVRKKGLEQDTGGFVASAMAELGDVDLHLGLSFQNFAGYHYGFLTSIGNEAAEYKYYDSDAWKSDAGSYAKISWALCESFRCFADLQLRYVNYRTEGINDKFYKLPDGSFLNQVLDIDENYLFFNPKAGLSWKSGGHSVFASAAVSHREPERNNFTDNGAYPAPIPEMLADYESGYSFDGRVFNAGLTLYLMKYRNQFVRTGAVSDIGEALTTNIARSYRTGAELTASVNAASWISFEAHGAFSSNRLKDFDEVVEDWDAPDGARTVHYDTSPLAFSPAVVAGAGFNLHFGGLRIDWFSNYVSRQFMDNTGCSARSIPAFSATDLDFGFDWFPKRTMVRECDFSVKFCNLFNSHHACSGWVYSAICESCGHGESNRYTQIGYIPSAGCTVMGSVSLHF